MFTEREKLISAVAAAALAGAFVFRFAVAPVLDRNSALDAEIAVIDKKIGRYKRLLSQKSSLEGVYAGIFPRQAVPGGEAGERTFLSGLDSLASSAGVRVYDVRPQDASSDDDGSGACFDIRAEGSLTGLMRFVGEIERSADISGIKRLQVNIRTSADTLEASMTVSGAGR